MSEGGVLGKLGFGEETEEVVDPDTVSTPPDPMAAAMAAEQARTDPELAAAAADYFRQQSRFIEIQTEHLHEQRTLNLRHLRVRRWRETLQLGVQLAVVIAATVVVAALLVMIHDAFTSRQVVIEAFDAPASLTARGLTGKVVASGVLDSLTRLQEASRLADHRRLTEAWTREIQIDVPETGVSLGELNRAIKARFGQDIHITGDLVQADDGQMLLTVRGDGVSPRTFAGPPGALDGLTNKAAEYLFGQAEPVDYANFLSNAGRNAEAVAFIRQAYGAAPAAARPQLLVAWGNSLSGLGGSMRDVLALYRSALTLKRDYWAAYADAMNAAWAMGDEEGAWKLGATMRHAAHGRPGRAPEVFYQNWDALTWNLQAWRKALQTDEDHVMGESSVANAPAIADIDVRLHDDADARLQLQTVPNDPKDPTIPAMTHFIRGRIAAETGDAVTAASEMEAFAAAYANPEVANQYPGYGCWVIPTEEAVGRREKADAVLKSSGRFIDCLRFRGDILAGRGDWAGANVAYLQATAAAPDLPAAYYSWGIALLGHGDLDAAAARLADAHQRAPGWADPLKAMGDVMVKKGRWREAATDYDQALRFAPAWVALMTAQSAAAVRAQADTRR